MITLHLFFSCYGLKRVFADTIDVCHAIVVVVRFVYLKFVINPPYWVAAVSTVAILL